MVCIPWLTGLLTEVVCMNYIASFKNQTEKPLSNQIRVVAYNVQQLTQASFLQTNQTLQNGFFYICNAEMAQSLRSLEKSEFLKLIISFFYYFWCQNWDQWHKMSGKNTHIYIWFVCKNEACVNCGKLNATTLILLLGGNLHLKLSHWA